MLLFTLAAREGQNTFAILAVSSYCLAGSSSGVSSFFDPLLSLLTFKSIVASHKHYVEDKYV